MSDAAPARIVGFDLWRSLLMLGGLFVHGALWLPPAPLFSAVVLASNTFRMGGFFAISGYLAALLLARGGRPQWARRRLVTLGVPTLVALALTGPVIRALVAHYRPDVAPPMAYDWHHLWFLVALIAYVPGACLLDRLLPAGRARVALPPERVLLLVATASAGLTVAAMIPLAGLPREYYDLGTNGRLIPGYFPLFALGFAVARDARLRDVVTGQWRGCALVLAGLAVAYLAWFVLLAPALPKSTAETLTTFVTLIGITVGPPAATTLIVRSALALRRVPRWVPPLCDAAFTIYLVHLPLIVAINLAGDALPLDRHLRYLLAVGLGGTLSYALHALLVRRSPLLRFLLNGRWPRRRGDGAARGAAIDARA